MDGFSAANAAGFDPAVRSDFGNELELAFGPTSNDGFVAAAEPSTIGLAAAFGGEPFLSFVAAAFTDMAADREAPKSYRLPKAWWLDETLGFPGASGRMYSAEGLFLYRIGESPIRDKGFGEEENS